MGKQCPTSLQSPERSIRLEIKHNPLPKPILPTPPTSLGFLLPNSASSTAHAWGLGKCSSHNPEYSFLPLFPGCSFSGWYQLLIENLFSMNMVPRLHKYQEFYMNLKHLPPTLIIPTPHHLYSLTPSRVFFNYFPGIESYHVSYQYF